MDLIKYCNEGQIKGKSLLDWQLGVLVTCTGVALAKVLKITEATVATLVVLKNVWMYSETPSCSHMGSMWDCFPVNLC